MRSAHGNGAYIVALWAAYNASMAVTDTGRACCVISAYSVTSPLWANVASSLSQSPVSCPGSGRASSANQGSDSERANNSGRCSVPYKAAPSYYCRWSLSDCVGSRHRCHHGRSQRCSDKGGRSQPLQSVHSTSAAVIERADVQSALGLPRCRSFIDRCRSRFGHRTPSRGRSQLWSMPIHRPMCVHILK